MQRPGPRPKAIPLLLLLASALGLLAFDVAQTVISQYANSPVLLALLRRLNTALDQAANIEQFYTLVWDLRTAVGYGLDVWGRIVGVNRVLRVPTTAYTSACSAT